MIMIITLKPEARTQRSRPQIEVSVHTLGEIVVNGVRSAPKNTPHRGAACTRIPNPHPKAAPKLSNPHPKPAPESRTRATSLQLKQRTEVSSARAELGKPSSSA